MNDKIDLINSKVEFNDYDKAIIKKIFDPAQLLENAPDSSKFGLNGPP